MPATTRGREFALKALWQRRKRSDKANRISYTTYSDCISCGLVADSIPNREVWVGSRSLAKLCGECRAMKDLGWLDQ